MPDLLLELFSEEIPARMQRKAAEDLKKLVTDALVEAGLAYEGARAFVTPRRLALSVHDLPARSPDRREEKKGPRVGAPAKAVEGFLKSAGLTSIDQAKVQRDKKGDFYIAVVERPGRPAGEVIAEIVPAIVRAFPWPKSMRWGKGIGDALLDSKGDPLRDSNGDVLRDESWLRWVRPLHSILCTFGPETEEPDVVAFEVGGIASGNTTAGHRFMAPTPITVRRLDDYMAKLEAAHVVLDAERRKDLILHDARDQALALGLELVEDDALADEVSGLVEWPVVLAGSFDRDFLDLPPEVVRTTIRNNQKCFVLSQEARSAGGATGKQETNERKLANKFVLVANIEASDGGKAIVAGNERVIRARLSDARHFWKTDLGSLPDYRDKADKPLDQRLEKLKAQNIVFHEKLGTQGERVERIVRLAKEIAPLVGADPAKAERAARLAKADLVTEMVGEFPELQGLMGKYYALAQGEDASVAAAIEDHYKPLGPSDRVPTDPVAIAVALADKLDMLVGFWAIDEKPTGSKDPYALRRAALGVIRMLLERQARLQLLKILVTPLRRQLLSVNVAEQRRLNQLLARENPSSAVAFSKLAQQAVELEARFRLAAQPQADELLVLVDLLAFFADRLKVQIREQGARADLVDAVFALGQGRAAGSSPSPLEGEVGFPRSAKADRSEIRERGETDGVGGQPLSLSLPRKGGGDEKTKADDTVQDDLLLIVRRVEALGKFLDTEDGRNLLAGTKRAANILRDEEKKSGATFDADIDAALLTEPEEKALAAAIDIAIPAATRAVAAEDFAAAMAALAGLRAPVDAFFEKVLVNAPDETVRANRLRLLNRIRQATLAVADFSKVAG